MSEPSYVHPLSTAGLNEVPPKRCLHSVGTLAELYGLPAQTIRRALDRSVKHGTGGQAHRRAGRADEEKADARADGARLAGFTGAKKSRPAD
jgi:hypothetical protein